MCLMIQRRNEAGKFYRLLEVSRPDSFPRHGKLTPRQIERTLSRRSNLGSLQRLQAMPHLRQPLFSNSKKLIELSFILSLRDGLSLLRAHGHRLVPTPSI